MKIKDLIKKLKHYPSDLEVGVFAYDRKYHDQRDEDGNVLESKIYASSFDLQKRTLRKDHDSCWERNYPRSESHNYSGRTEDILCLERND